MPAGWLNTTTHRLDIYDEKLAKTEFLEQFETLFNDNNSELLALSDTHSLRLYSVRSSLIYTRMGDCQRK
jgi:hypothetical protein